MRDPKTAIRTIPSPDNNYCVCYFTLPTPEKEPLKLTFTIYRILNDIKEAVFDLPENNYCVDGIDYVIWECSSTAISYSINSLERIHYLDFIFKIDKWIDVPKHLIKKRWDEDKKMWTITSGLQTDDLDIEYDPTQVLTTTLWNNTRIALLVKSRRNHPLYKVFFHNLDKEMLYAELADYFVHNPALVNIDESGMANIPLCDASMKAFFWVTCDLNQFGKDKVFIVKSHDPKISDFTLPIQTLPPSQNLFFDVKQNYKALGESGLLDCSPLWFVNRQNGVPHYSTDLFLLKDGQWDKSRTKFFFNGYDGVTGIIEDTFDWPDYGTKVFVVLDVLNRECIKMYKGHAVRPRWNLDETNVLFDKLELDDTREAQKQNKQLRQKEEQKKRAKQKKEEARLEAEEQKRRAFDKQKRIVQTRPIPAHVKLDVCAIEDPEKPGSYHVGITSQDHEVVYLIIKPYILNSPKALQRHGNIICFYCTVPNLISSIIVRFDMRDIYTKNEISLSIWDLHKQANSYVWSKSDSRWQPVINGEIIHPARFYYDDLSTEKIPIQKTETSRDILSIIFDLFRR